jgi:hypothetical protein
MEIGVLVKGWGWRDAGRKGERSRRRGSEIVRDRGRGKNRGVGSNEDCGV